MTPIAGREASVPASEAPSGTPPAPGRGAAPGNHLNGRSEGPPPGPARPSTPPPPSRDGSDPPQAPKTPRGGRHSELSANPPSTPSSASRDYSSAAAYLSSPVRSSRAAHLLAAGTMTPGRPSLKFSQPASPFRSTRSYSGSGGPSGQLSLSSPVSVPPLPVQTLFMTKDQAMAITDLDQAKASLVQALDQADTYHKAAQQFRNLANHHIFQRKLLQVESDESERRFEVETNIQKREIEKLVVDIMGYDKSASTDQIRKRLKKTKQRVREMSDLVEAKNRQIGELQTAVGQLQQVQAQLLAQFHHSPPHPAAPHYDNQPAQQHHPPQQHAPPPSHQPQHHLAPPQPQFPGQSIIIPQQAPQPGSGAHQYSPASLASSLPVPVPSYPGAPALPPGSVPLSLYQPFARPPVAAFSGHQRSASQNSTNSTHSSRQYAANPEDSEMKMGNESSTPTPTSAPAEMSLPPANSTSQPSEKPRPPPIDTSTRDASSAGPASAETASVHSQSQPASATAAPSDKAFSDLELLASQTLINGFQQPKPAAGGQPLSQSAPKFPPVPAMPASAPTSAHPGVYGTSPYSSPFYSPFSPYAVPPQQTRQLHFGSPEKRRRPSSSSTISAVSEDDTLEDPTNTA